MCEAEELKGKAPEGVCLDDQHPIDGPLYKAYLVGWMDGANGVRERNLTEVVMEGRAVVLGCTGGGAADD